MTDNSQFQKYEIIRNDIYRVYSEFCREYICFVKNSYCINFIIEFKRKFASEFYPKLIECADEWIQFVVDNQMMSASSIDRSTVVVQWDEFLEECCVKLYTPQWRKTYPILSSYLLTRFPMIIDGPLGWGMSASEGRLEAELRNSHDDVVNCMTEVFCEKLSLKSR